LLTIELIIHEVTAMRCSAAEVPSEQSGLSCGRERCLFTSVMMLGALFGLMASPAARVPLVSTFVVVGVPLMTFAVAAPSRLGLLRELALLLRGAEAFGLAALCMLVGRKSDARAVLLRQRVRVENSYSAPSDGSEARLAPVIAADPLRLHHVRRLALLGTVLALVAGNVLPLLRPETYTWGDGAMALAVFLLDCVVIGVVSRIVTERMAIRLLEATSALSGGHPMAARLRVVPLATMLGAAMGAVGALVVLSAAAAASAVETSWVVDTHLVAAGFWFIRETAPYALPLGIGIGGVLGAGAGLAQPPRE
jgi:hypothetical protein